MKVLAINGSPRKDYNTKTLTRKVFEPLENSGIETELVQTHSIGESIAFILNKLQ